MRKFLLVIIGIGVAGYASAAAGIAAATPPTNAFDNLRSTCAAPLELPSPTGPNQVGVTSFAFVDHARQETLTPDAGDLRQVLFQVWYPAHFSRAAPPVPYVPELQTMRAGFSADNREAPQKIARDLEHYSC